jgi:hypothetical protein
VKAVFEGWGGLGPEEAICKMTNAHAPIWHCGASKAIKQRIPVTNGREIDAASTHTERERGGAGERRLEGLAPAPSPGGRQVATRTAGCHSKFRQRMRCKLGRPTPNVPQYLTVK